MTKKSGEKAEKKGNREKLFSLRCQLVIAVLRKLLLVVIRIQSYMINKCKCLSKKKKGKCNIGNCNRETAIGITVVYSKRLLIFLSINEYFE